MSLFRTPSFRLKKREKAHRPPPLEQTPEKKEQETSETMDAPGSSFLVVPDTARSTFFTLPSGMSSRSSLFGRNSTSSQDEKKTPSFFKLPNLSRGSFVLKREREERKWGRSDEFTRISSDLDGCGYSKRSESASNLLELLVKTEKSSPPTNSNVRQRRRTLSTKSLPGTPDHQHPVFTDIPPLEAPPPLTVRASLDTPSKPKAVSVPPRLSLDNRVSPIRLPSFGGLSTRLGPISPSVASDLSSPTSPTSPTLDEPTITVRMGQHSPSPTVISAMTMSTIQDSLLGDYGLSASSSESDHDQTFAPGEDECRPHTRNLFASSNEALASSKKRIDGSDRTPPRLTITSSGRRSPLESSSRNEPGSSSIGAPELSEDIPSSFRDPFESYFEDIPAMSPNHNGIRSFEVSMSQLDIPTLPVHELETNHVRAGSSSPSPSPSPSPRKPRPRKVPPAVVTSKSNPSTARSNTLTVPADEPPSSPPSPSFLLGLAWPRPPLRQIYIDSRKPSASWHAVSRTIDERLIDRTGMLNTDPCHVIMLAHADLGTKLAESFVNSGMSGGRRRSGTVMRDQQPLTPTAVSALASFALRTTPLVINKWDQHIHPPAFDNERRKQSGCLSSGTSGSGHSSTHSELSEKEVNFSSPSSLGSTCHVIPNLEAHLYYFGICGHRHGGPKLIFRSSKDVFTLTLGPEQYPRMMQLLPVYHHNKLAQDNLWQTIRSEVVKLLDERGIRLTSVDLARFRWEEPNADGSSKIVTTPVTIWVGVLPDTLTGDIAFESSRDILQLLQEHSIFNIDVAYRESVTRPLSGPELLAPVSDFHPPEDAIVPVTTALGMSIAGLKTPHMQGTLGFFFRVGEALYGVTARHVLFPEEEGNYSYSYVTGPKKEVALMGNTAFADLLASIQARIGILNNTSDGSNDAQVVSGLASTEGDMRKKKAAIEELKKFYIKMKKEWSELNERVIGYVVWAPPISVLTPPHGYTKDMCVIKLNEKKFSRNFKGNVIDLGPEIEPGQFMSFMYPRHDAPSEFDYPEDRLFRLRAILSADEISDPNNQDHNGDPVRFVIKRGLTTRTTIGRLTGFESHARRYTVLGHLDSLEAAIYPYDNDSGPFSRGGDSGSLIAGSLAKFGALLTGGTGTTDSSDITYVTPMYWLWNEVIKPKFPGATLYFDIPEN